MCVAGSGSGQHAFLEKLYLRYINRSTRIYARDVSYDSFEVGKYKVQTVYSSGSLYNQRLYENLKHNELSLSDTIKIHDNRRTDRINKRVSICRQIHAYICVYFNTLSAGYSKSIIDLERNGISVLKKWKSCQSTGAMSISICCETIYSKDADQVLFY